MAQTVLELMRSDRGQANIAEMMHQRFGCPGKNYPCIKKYTEGVKVCEGCWINFFHTLVPEVDKESKNETTKEADIGTKEDDKGNRS